MRHRVSKGLGKDQIGIEHGHNFLDNEYVGVSIASREEIVCGVNMT